MSVPADPRADFHRELWKYRDHLLRERWTAQERWLPHLLRELRPMRALDASAEWGQRIPVLRDAGAEAEAAVDDAGHALALGRQFEAARIPVRYCRWGEFGEEFADDQPFDLILHLGLCGLPGQELLLKTAAGLRTILRDGGSVVFRCRWDCYHTEDQKNEVPQALMRMSESETHWGDTVHRIHYASTTCGITESHELIPPDGPPTIVHRDFHLYHTFSDLRAAFLESGFGSVVPLDISHAQPKTFAIAKVAPPTKFMARLHENLGLASHPVPSSSS